MSGSKHQITIIGAGVVGLAIAAELSAQYDDLLVLEKNFSFGQETSSRNSEVIHAGIYYPAGLKKTVFCREGNPLLYEFCRINEIPHNKIGKLIVATDIGEEGELHTIKSRAEQNGVNDLYFLSKQEIGHLEPDVNAVSAIFSPSTGIIDSHSLMRCFLRQAEQNGAVIAFRSAVTSVNYNGNSYDLLINEGEHRVRTEVLVNSAGLHSEQMAAMVGIDIDDKKYRIKYCKGNYFAASPSPRLSHLVYPVPVKNNEGLGIHATLDLTGRVRFGPDTEYLDVLDYNVNQSRRDAFHKAICTYLPEIKIESLYPDMSGIRPKLQGPGEAYRDFVVEEETVNGYPRLINLIGIESPGLTSCLSIAQYVASLVQASLS